MSELFLALLIIALFVVVGFLIYQQRHSSSSPSGTYPGRGATQNDLPSAPIGSPANNLGAIPSPVPSVLEVPSPSIATPQANLMVLSGPAKGHTIPLRDENFLIERRPGSLLEQDLRVSRHHAMLEQRNGTWYVYDLASTNGTYINNQPLRPKQYIPLQPGTELRFGSVTVARFVLTAAPATPGNPPNSPATYLAKPTLNSTVSHGRSGHRLSDRYYFEEQPRGKGGFALVYQGQDHQTRQKVALKVLPDYATLPPQVQRRFEQEGELNLQHPNIAKILDWGRTVDGPIRSEVLFILMEWMEGGTLRERLRNPAGFLRNYAETARIVDSVCSALEYAHNNPYKRIVHRDIKPENIMFNGDNTVKVVDFGIASVANEVRMTEFGTRMGTPTYMAPEQAKGELNIEPPTDIYSIAVVAFELLTATRLFTGANHYEVMEHHIQSTPDAPTMRNPQLPSAVDEVMLRALDKSPVRRYDRATQFARALREALGV